MLTIALSLLLAAAIAAAGGFALLARRHWRRLHAAERAVVALTQAWSEDGSSRGRVCSAARLIGGAGGAFIAEPTRRGDELEITAEDGVPDLAGLRVPADPDSSLMARALLLGETIHVGRPEDYPHGDPHPAAVANGIRSAHLRPIRHGTSIVGVLVVGWPEEQHALRPEREELVAALAAEAGQAIVRDHEVALLHRQASTDELTALPNRRAWDEAVTRELARAQRTGEPLCLALLDLDHFKAFNDNFGHQAGDAHLRKTAAAWRRELRTMDVLARYGGEEFGALLPSCDLDLAREVIDRVRAATPNDQTASAGVVLFDGAESAEDLLARADAALYRAKRAGRAMTVGA